MLGKGGSEEEINLRAGGEGGVEVGCEGGFEARFGGEVFGDAAGELVVAADAERAAATRKLVEAVEVEWEERVR